MTSGYRITLTYKLRAIPVEGHSKEGSDAEASISGAAPAAEAAGSTSWLTHTDILSSQPLLDTFKQLLHNKNWHQQGEALSDLDSWCGKQTAFMASP